jgi:putative transposase
MRIKSHKTYKYRLYRCDKKDRHLLNQINISGIIWNHTLALQKQYYRLTGKYISVGRMKAHIAKLRMGGVQANKRLQRPAKKYGQKYTFWQAVGSQAVQNILERQDEAYQRFFKGLAKSPPKSKRIKKYKSFTLKQSGWDLSEDTNVRVVGGENGGKVHQKATGHIRIGNHLYKFNKYRPLAGEIKTLTIKRDAGYGCVLVSNVS